MLLLNRVQAVKDFREKRLRLVDDDIKRNLIEKCAADIMCDLERLTDRERTKFDAKYGNLVEEMMVKISMLPPREQCNQNSYRINYRIFDFEAIMELRINLLEYLRHRDRRLIPGLLPK